MLKTVLIVVLMNLANPSEPARMVHKAFPTPQACESAFINYMSEMPIVPSVKVSAFCAKVTDLADEKAS